MWRILVVTALLVAACGDDESTIETGGGIVSGDVDDPNEPIAEDEPFAVYPEAKPSDGSSTVCQPSGPIEGAGSDTPFEDVEEYLTGWRITAETEGQEPPDDPNFGGVWGDFDGGLVLGLVDCSNVDLDEIARIGGGSDRVRIIQVQASYTDHYKAIDTLYERLGEFEVEVQGFTDWTLDGPRFTLLVDDLTAIPDGFGADLPLTITIEEGAMFVEGGDEPIG